MKYVFDAVIIGAGQAGPSLAAKLSERERKTALVERKLLGGTCVNTGCTPTKTMVASAEVAHKVRTAGSFGVQGNPDVRVSLADVVKRADEIVSHSREGLRSMIQGLEHCTLFENSARFESAQTVRVGDDVLQAEQFFVNVGGRPHTPPMPGLDQVPYLTSSSILRLTELPEHLVVVGGGYIGLEFAQMFRRFGAEVTLVEMGPRLASHEDEDASEALKELFEGEGAHLRLDAKCIGFSLSGEKIRVHVDCHSGEPEVIGSHVLIAVGRQPNTDDLGLAAAGVATDQRGYIVVDDQLRTNVPHIWALGDCNGRGAFTHTAYNDYEIVAANLGGTETRRVTDRIQAHALYTDPPLAQIGLTEAEVRRSGKQVLVGKRPMTRVNRALEKGESFGFMKVFVDAETERILGASLLGVGADEVIHTLLASMYADVPYTRVTRSVYIHPTVSELLPTLLEDLHPLT